eukprot:CAMPEP_0113541726 /NCGR_PEP_ID=MMETSP0015_2-20120614/9199_1 /TAXON_ID=2838 /ORGANISM="Odontella" /LENGTH=233 /DNA_ID=CAMNT_0000441679 /DNA_START=93 /DNA_END=791 /DNA_ORIENTATION=+ /assembly_acc=CAM_ASM_000160
MTKTTAAEGDREEGGSDDVETRAGTATKAPPAAGKDDAKEELATSALVTLAPPNEKVVPPTKVISAGKGTASRTHADRGAFLARKKGKDKSGASNDGDAPSSVLDEKRRWEDRGREARARSRGSAKSDAEEQKEEAKEESVLDTKQRWADRRHNTAGNRSGHGDELNDEELNDERIVVSNAMVEPLPSTTDNQTFGSDVVAAMRLGAHHVSGPNGPRERVDDEEDAWSIPADN